MKVGIIGLGHAFYKQFEALKSIEDIELVALCDIKEYKLEEFKNNYYITKKYKNLINICDYVLIATPPKTHLKIASFFMKHNVGVILEKPTVVNLSELTRLNKSIKKYGANFYNILHFSFGKEVLWFKSNLSNFGLPNKIKVFISDKYVENQKIKECAINLSGAYLDETINPISAIANIFGYNITSNNLTKQKYKKRFDDHYCTSTFILNNDIEISVEVDWSKNINDKYIDLFYSNKVIRLDSMNQSVIDLNLNKVLFRCDGERMTNHYKGGFQNFLCEPNNISKSMKLHKEILKLV